MIKMIVLDLDGTLLRDDKSVSEYTIDILKKCRDKGIKVIFATVRSTTDDVAPPEWFHGCVKKSGAVAYDGSQLVYERVMPIDDVRSLLLACDRARIKAVAQNCCDSVHYSNFNVTEEWSYIADYKKVDFAEIEFDVAKIYTVAETTEDLRLIKNNLPKNAYLFTSRDNITFVSHKEAVKSKATAALAEHWGIKSSEVVAFGDDLIDIDILEWCGAGVAMNNALDEVKAVADFICDTNENDGVAKWVEKYVL
jgi:hypothetical protein